MKSFAVNSAITDIYNVNLYFYWLLTFLIETLGPL